MTNFEGLTIKELKATIRGNTKQWRRFICRALVHEGRIPDAEPSLVKVRLEPGNPWRIKADRAAEDAMDAQTELDKRGRS